MKFKFAPLLSIMFIAAPAAIFVTPAPPAFAEDEKTADEQLLDEIRMLREAVQTLEGRMTGIEKSIWELSIIQIETISEQHMARGRTLTQPETPELPENADREAVKKYIEELLGTTDTWGSYYNTDGYIELLTKVGPENVNVLLEYLNYEGGRGGSYVKWAIEALANDEHRQLIMDELREHHELANLVIKMGWQEDAREILIEAVRSDSEFLYPDLVDAVAALKAPETYDALVEYLINGENRFSTYQAIKGLPIDLDAAAVRMWSKVKDHGNKWEMQVAGMIAVSHGVADALDYEFVQLAEPPDRYASAESYHRRVVTRHTEARGSDEALLAWYEQNKDNLVFDAEAQVFRVRDSDVLINKEALR